MIDIEPQLNSNKSFYKDKIVNFT